MWDQQQKSERLVWQLNHSKTNNEKIKNMFGVLQKSTAFELPSIKK